jgi:tRNA (guanine-N7-)-methyltransferase
MAEDESRTTKHESQSYLASFGRRQGRKLRDSRSALFETLLPKLQIDLPNIALSPAQALPSPLSPQRGEGQGEGEILQNIFPDYKAPLWFELGFGGGEHLAAQALANPHVNFIGCEPYVNGMSTLLVMVDTHKLINIRLFHDDARLLLEKMPDASIERLFILFPDPWPKNRHHKRRIISQSSLELFHRKLKPAGLMRIATDHVDYCSWILEQCLAFGKFKWTAQCSADWTTQPPDWVRTRYQAKAEAEGRNATFLDWIKAS